MIKNNTNTLQKSVLATLAYYRAVKTPLTLVQIGRYLIEISNIQHPISDEISKRKSQDSLNRTNLSEIKDVLDSLVEEGVLTEQKGLYWLKTSSITHETRNINKPSLHPLPRVKARGVLRKEGAREAESYKLQVTSYMKFIQLEKNAQRKINKVRKALKIFSFLPFLRGIFLCGSVARKVSRSGSDIDFLILTKQNRVWTVRFLLTFFSFLLGKKTNDATIKNKNKDSRRNKFCLNHYRSSSRLKLEEELRDLYSAQEYARMINIYSSNKIERKFFKKNKDWMKKYLPNFNFTKLPLFDTFQPRRVKIWLENMLSEKIGNIIEKLLFLLQSKKIEFSRNIARYVPTPDSKRVVTDDEVIMFHLNPRAPGVINRFENICQKLKLL